MDVVAAVCRVVINRVPSKYRDPNRRIRADKKIGFKVEKQGQNIQVVVSIDNSGYAGIRSIEL